jgi:colanic acid/amylovoran biosynthesis glycosyltransferase
MNVALEIPPSPRHARPDAEPLPMTVAYLMNSYPHTVYTFIRSEIAALEASGLRVQRFALRLLKEDSAAKEVDEERRKTRGVVAVGAVGLLAALVGTMAARPLAFARGALLAIRVGWRSDRGLLYHGIYLAEACVLRRWLASCGAGHVHAHFGTNSAAVVMLCRELGGPPYSFTAHGPDEFDMPKSLAIGEKIRRAAFVVAISQFCRGQLYRWVDAEEWPKIQVIRCGVDRAFLDVPTVPIPDSPRLVCVGRLAGQKAHHLLLQAVALLREEGIAFELVLIGDGPLRGDIERLIDRLGLGTHVRITGYISSEEVRREILEARALVLSSLAEGLPVAIMEALALGRPVVSTSVAGIPELVRPGVCGWLVPPGSVEDLSEALREVLAASTADLERMGRQGARRVAEFHDAAVEAGKLAASINRIVKNPG